MQKTLEIWINKGDFNCSNESISSTYKTALVTLSLVPYSLQVRYVNS